MKRKILNVLSALFGLMMVNSGLNKFFNYIPVPGNLPEPLVKATAALVAINWLLPLIATAEIAGGILVLFPKTRPLGVLVVFPVMVGVLLTHLCIVPDGWPIALILWAVLGWMIADNWSKYRVLIA
ncbi:DoxX family protein [Mucilaginibacter sp. PPCGB 2223]|uniref:DoxX family membrane protein n=1 Tax=Mucilaginibacter sp. PPCGB 2223 TaxID=1886027 RepID=UPI0008243966|nr:DoxX family membrane protein [Mucilaginibacter sp. PPCGB 2223]OCX54330.1 DoxX family protein [Mucilaginibacter sp. PPCGB 2223]